MFSILYYIFLLLLCVTFIVLSSIALVLCAPFDPARRVVHWFSSVMVNTFFLIPPMWRRRVEGRENYDPSKSYVIVMNHCSMMDIPTLYLLPLNFRWVSKREILSVPIFGQFLMLHGDITIKRSSGAQAMEQVSREGSMWIGRGVSIAIFPEGTRSKTGEMGRFKAGAFNLARETGVEILPVVLEGSRDIMKGWRFNWRSSITLRVLPPVKIESDDPTVMREVMGRVRGDMCEALDQMSGLTTTKNI